MQTQVLGFDGVGIRKPLCNFELRRNMIGMMHFKRKVWEIKRSIKKGNKVQRENI